MASDHFCSMPRSLRGLTLYRLLFALPPAFMPRQSSRCRRTMGHEAAASKLQIFFSSLPSSVVVRVPSSCHSPHLHRPASNNMMTTLQCDSDGPYAVEQKGESSRNNYEDNYNNNWCNKRKGNIGRLKPNKGTATSTNTREGQKSVFSRCNYATRGIAGTLLVLL